MDGSEEGNSSSLTDLLKPVEKTTITHLSVPTKLYRIGRLLSFVADVQVVCDDRLNYYLLHSRATHPLSHC